MWVGFFSLFIHMCLQIRTRGPLRAAGSPRWAEISVSFPLEIITVGEEEAAQTETGNVSATPTAVSSAKVHQAAVRTAPG